MRRYLYTTDGLPADEHCPDHLDVLPLRVWWETPGGRRFHEMRCRVPGCS